MKKLVVGLFGLAVFASSALAADLPVRTAFTPSPVLAPYSWTGCFIGGNGGGLWARKDWVEQAPVAGAAGGHTISSWVGGAQVGCDLQFGNWLVVGVQGDYDWTDAHGEHTDLITGTIDRTRVKSIASVTGRLGFGWDHWLYYGKGGAARAQDDYHRLVGGIPTAFAKENRNGWTGGVGVEYAFNHWMSMFAEYDYYGFGSRTVGFLTPGGAFNSNVAIKQNVQLVKVGVNFRWGGWAVGR
jgi:outer membrane immunogenic protein